MAKSGYSVKGELLELKRARIVEAALELFYKNGYAATTMDQIATALGATKPFVYAQFEGKAEVLAEICERGITNWMKTLDEISTRGLTPRLQLEAFAREAVRTVCEEQAYILVYVRQEKDVPAEAGARIDKMRADFDDRLAAILQAGVETGEFKITDVRLSTLMIAWMITSTIFWYRQDGRVLLADLCEYTVQAVLRLAGASESA